jgi:TRAP-type C4-dicarboxylate transport system substrate-binding protein
LIQRAADESAIYQRELWQRESERALEGIREAGIEIIEPDKEPFMDRMEPYYRDIEQDPVLGPLMERIRELADG